MMNAEITSTCDITFTTCRGDTSEYCHCDGIHFKSVTGCCVCTVGRRNQEQCTQSGNCTHDGVDDETDLLYMNT